METIYTYKITGIDRQGKRFKIVTGNYHHAMGINLWQGNVWESENGKNFKRIKSVFN